MKNLFSTIVLLFFASILWAQSYPAEVVNAYNNAGKAYRSGDPSGALRLLKDVSDEYPEFFNAHMLLAESSVKTQNENQAQRYYKRALEADPNNTDVLYRLGLSYGRSGDKAQARAAYQKVLNINPGHTKAERKLMALSKPATKSLPDVNTEKGSTVKEAPKTQVAVAPAPKKEVKKKNTKKINHYANQGVRYYNEDAFREAAKSFKLAIDASNGDPSARLLSYAGRSLLHIGSIEESIKFFKKAIEKGKDTGEYHYYLSKAYEKKGVPNLMEKYADMAANRGFAGTAEVFDKMAVKHFNKGLEMYNAKNYIGAIQEFKRAIKESPNKAKYYYSLGLAASKSKYYDEAESAFNQAISIDPGHHASYTQLGHMYEAQGEYKEAGSYYEAAIEAGDDSATAYYYVAYCFDRLENHKKAIPFFEEAEKRNPDDMEVRFACATSYYKAKLYGPAKERFVKLAEDAPKSARVMKNASTLFGSTGDFEKGLEYALAWVKLDPQNGAAYNQAGEMFNNLDQKDKAHKYKRKAKQLGYDKDTGFY